MRSRSQGLHEIAYYPGALVSTLILISSGNAEIDKVSYRQDTEGSAMTLLCIVHFVQSC